MVFADECEARQHTHCIKAWCMPHPNMCHVPHLRHIIWGRCLVHVDVAQGEQELGDPGHHFLHREGVRRECRPLHGTDTAWHPPLHSTHPA